MTRDKISFLHDSPRYEEYKRGETGVIVGFCMDRDDTPYAIIRKESGAYIMAELHNIIYTGETI